MGPTLNASSVHISVMAIAPMCTWLQELAMHVASAAAAATAHGVIVGDAAVASAQVPHPWALL